MKMINCSFGVQDVLWTPWSHVHSRLKKLYLGTSDNSLKADTLYDLALQLYKKGIIMLKNQW